MQTTKSRLFLTRSVAPALLIALLNGCAHTGAYDPSYLAAARRPSEGVIEGKALIVTSKEEDSYVFNDHPTSFTGAATTLSLPIGQIAKEAAKAAFADRFKGGAETTTAFESAQGYRLVVAPKVTKFSYAYNQLKNLGFAITPTVEANTHVRVLGSDGSIRSEHDYASGPVEAPSYMLSSKPGEAITKLAHRVLYDLMSKAADDAVAGLSPVTENR